MSEPITVEAVYENGVLKPAGKLPLSEGQKVVVIVRVPSADRMPVPAEPLTRDPKLIEWAAMDKELEYDFGEDWPEGEAKP
jgi:predicted DNA-binding antitoxin AbrB/MazE fold protein